MSKVYITSNTEHYLFEELSKLENFVPFEKATELHSTDFLYDFTVLKNKKEFLNSIKSQVYTDLSIHNTEDFLDLKNIKIMFSTVFYSPQNAFEFKVIAPELKSHFLEFFPLREFKGVEINHAGIGFIFPRILVQIINEAYFAIHEKVAEAKDIDVACKYGVSYPLGPVEWGLKSKNSNVKALLDELHRCTKEARYLRAPNL